MKPEEFVYKYTHPHGHVFFATEANAAFIIGMSGGIYSWKKEYVAEVWQITGEE